MLIRKAVGVNLEQSMISHSVSQVCSTKKLLLLLCFDVFHQCSFSWTRSPHLQHMLALPFISVARASAEHSLTFMSFSVRLISEQNLLQAWDTTAFFLRDCSYPNPEQKINSWINCWACLADQSFTITTALEAACLLISASSEIGIVLNYCLTVDWI